MLWMNINILQIQSINEWNTYKRTQWMLTVQTSTSVLRSVAFSGEIWYTTGIDRLIDRDNEEEIDIDTIWCHIRYTTRLRYLVSYSSWKTIGGL